MTYSHGLNPKVSKSEQIRNIAISLQQMHLPEFDEKEVRGYASKLMKIANTLAKEEDPFFALITSHKKKSGSHGWG